MTARIRPAAAILMIALTALAAASEALAQGLVLRPVQSPRELMADQLVILARDVMSGQDEIRPDQVQRARALLEFSLGLNAEDAEIWELRHELALHSGNALAARRALAKYVEFAPDDERARLRLLLQRVEQQQTVDQRMVAVRQLLSDAETLELTDPIRSRLASYLATALFEQEDQAEAVAQLRNALKLDPTNRTATRLMARIVMEKDPDARQTAGVLMLLISAEPLNPQLRAQLAEWLLSQHAYEKASEQYELAMQLWRESPDATFFGHWAMSLAGHGQIEEASDLLGQLERSIRLARQRTRAEQAGEEVALPDALDEAPTDEIPEPGDTVLPLDLQLVRLGIYYAADDQARADAAFATLAHALQQRIEQGDASARIDLAWTCAWFGYELEAAARMANELAAESPDHPVVQRTLAYLEARGVIEVGSAPELPADDPFGMFLQAVSLPTDSERRHRLLQQVVNQSPTTVLGMMSAVGLVQHAEGAKPSPIGGSMVAAIERSPGELLDPTISDLRWTSLQVRTERLQFGYLDPIELTFEFGSETDFPVALGSEGVLPTRAMVFIEMNRPGAPPVEVAPLVVNLDKRISLGRRESFTHTVRLDRSQLGWYMANLPTEPVKISATAVLDPRPRMDDPLARGPLGTIGQIALIERTNQPATPEMLSSHLESLAEPGRLQRMKSLAVLLNTVGLLPTGDDQTLAARQQIGTAINEALVDMDPLLQAWTINFLPNRQQDEQGLFEPARAMAQRSDDPLVRVLYLARHVAEPFDPAVNAAQRHDNEVVRDYAAAHKRGLEIEIEKARAAEAERLDEAERQRGN